MVETPGTGQTGFDPGARRTAKWVWSTGTGADVMKPIAAPMIGGMISSAVHVLIMTPVIFVLMKTRDLKKGKLHYSGMKH